MSEEKENKEICTCECHINSNIMHFMPCCYTCEDCGQNIKFKYVKDHWCPPSTEVKRKKLSKREKRNRNKKK